MNYPNSLITSEKTVKKAENVCENSSISKENQFVEFNKTIELGKDYTFTWSEIVEVSNRKPL